MGMKLTSQEIEVWHVLPAVRSELAKEMKSLGMLQKDIAKILGLTQAAISQYFSNKRGCNITFNDCVQKQIKESAGKLKQNPEELFKELYDILQSVRDTGLLCQIHKEFTDMKECKCCKNNENG
ncbi:helix-turn-helix domain-containing protein [Candidatus Woesearchaeota archaeon]|nr:helix-turn-helix domain-containing protein [Candidatus Woesearchaeota archaeon]MBW3014752.1 helix-turn-helix domain-containing protein [Candidatus Woesearchaeota archaeon]